MHKESNGGEVVFRLYAMLVSHIPAKVKAISDERILRVSYRCCPDCVLSTVF